MHARLHGWFVYDYRKALPLAPTVERLLRNTYRGWAPARQAS